SCLCGDGDSPRPSGAEPASTQLLHLELHQEPTPGPTSPAAIPDTYSDSRCVAVRPLRAPHSFSRTPGPTLAFPDRREVPDWLVRAKCWSLCPKDTSRHCALPGPSDRRAAI